jgi:PAS domain S-box-containing protein
MGEVLKGENQDISLEWVTQGGDGQETQIFARGKDQPPGVLLGPRTFHLEAGGQTWKLTFRPTAAFDASAGRFRPHLVFTGGALISLLLFALARSLTLTWHRARVLAEKMTDSLRASTQLNQAQWEAMPLAAMVVDKAGRIQSWNKAAIRMFGFGAAEACGRSLIDTLVQEDSRDAFRHLWKRLEQGLEGQRANHLGLTKQGLTPPCTWYGATLRDAKGHFEGVAFLVDDLSERIKAEEALRHAQRLESLGMLAGGVAHDFNNLFTALLGNLSMAKLQAGEDGPGNRYLESAEAITFQASKFAQQLLAYSGKGTFHVEPTHLSKLVEKLSSLLKAALPKLVVLQVDLAENLPLVRVDSAQLQQVIMNLVMNGAEAIGIDRTGLIRIVTGQTHLSAAEGEALQAGGPLPAGDYVSLEVHDTGCGMAPDVLERIFDPFFTTKQKGHGLGLSAILGILRAHGAGLSIQTREGTGTTFRIYLAPLVEGTSREARDQSGPVPGIEARKGPCTLLLVDDEEDLRAAAESMLTHLGCRVLLAEDGVQALERLTEHPDIDLVLMDLSMPRMGGVEAFLQIRARWPRLKVILSSGYDQAHSIESLRDMPPAGFLSKPYNLKNLSQAVHQAMASPPAAQGEA